MQRDRHRESFLPQICLNFRGFLSLFRTLSNLIDLTQYTLYYSSPKKLAELKPSASFHTMYVQRRLSLIKVLKL